MKLLVRSVRACSLWGLPLLVAVALGVSTARAASAAPSATLPASSGQEEKTSSNGPHGLVPLLDDALSQAALRPDQVTAIDRLEDDIEETQMAAGDAERNLMVALADQIEGGGTDEDAVKPQIDAVAQASANASRAVRRAFEGLHQILDASQRGRFVDAFKKTLAEAPPENAQRQKAAANANPNPNAGFDAWAKELGLSDDQKQQIARVVQKPVSGPAPGSFDLGKVLDAFRGDDFVLDHVAPAEDVPSLAGAMARQMVATTLAVAQILTPEQRSREAGRLRARLNPTKSGSGATENRTPNIHLLRSTRTLRTSWGEDSSMGTYGLRSDNDFRHHRDRHRHDRGWDRYYQSWGGDVAGWAFRGLSPYLSGWKGWSSGYGYPYFGAFAW